MTPEEHKERKRGMQLLKRKKLKLGKIRQFARSCRKDTKDSGDNFQEDSVVVIVRFYVCTSFCRVPV